MEKKKENDREVKHDEAAIGLVADPPKILKGVVIKPPTAAMENK